MIIIDRFEDGEAMLETDEGVIAVRRALVPPDAQEGDVLVRENGAYRVDAGATAARRDVIERKLRMLLGGEG